MVSFTYRGLCAPVFTIFNKDQSVNTELIPQYAQFLADKGIDGVLVHGTSGEGMSMTVAERKQVIDEWVKAVKTTKQHLMVQVGGCPLPDVLDLAKYSEKVGVDSILCLPELYFKPSNTTELITYLKPVAAAAPNTPILYYHIPVWTNVNVNMEQFLNQVGDHIPNFKGIKYTSNDLDGGLAALRVKNRSFAVFLGADTLIAPALAAGFDSIIATSLNLIPGHSISIAKAIKENNVAEARRIQDEISAILAIISKNGPWVPTMKVATTLLTPIDVGKAREPLINLTDEHREQMKTAFKAKSLL